MSKLGSSRGSDHELIGSLLSRGSQYPAEIQPIKCSNPDRAAVPGHTRCTILSGKGPTKLPSDPGTPKSESDLTITTSVCAENGIAIGVVTGTIDVEGFKHGATLVWQTPGWLRRAIVWDLRQARFELSSSDLEQFAIFIQKHQPKPPPCRIAFVTTTDLEFGLSRIFQAFRETPETEFEVFRDYAAALQWAENA